MSQSNKENCTPNKGMVTRNKGQRGLTVGLRKPNKVLSVNTSLSQKKVFINRFVYDPHVFTYIVYFHLDFLKHIRKEDKNIYR